MGRRGERRFLEGKKETRREVGSRVFLFGGVLVFVSMGYSGVGVHKERNGFSLQENWV